MSLSAEQVRWVAHLARLDLTEAELGTMTRQLAAIVAYVDQLRQVNTDGVEPLAHALDVHNVFRDDEPAPSLPVAEALANAPDRRSDAKVRAFLHVDEASALEQARRVDGKRRSGQPLGALAGLPVAVKDVLCTRGQPTTCASKILKNFVPPYDAHVIGRLRAADA